MDDLAVPQHHRSGAHRARRHPLLVALVTLGVFGAAAGVLLWALLALDVLGVGDDLLEAGGVTPSSEAPLDPSAAPSEPAAPTTAAAEPGPEPSAAPEPSAEPSPEATVERSLPLDVLNSTATAGLAAGAADQLEGLGWTIGEVTNYDGDEIPTTVLVPDEQQRATAEAVAADLGVGTVTVSADVDVLTVVLGPDYPG